MPSLPATRLTAAVRPFSAVESSPPWQFFLLHSQSVVVVRGTSMLIAAYLFRQSHGRFPEAAAELVPEFLGATPADPFDASCGPLHYRLDLGGPTVWSVGENGVDDNARLNPIARPERFQGQLDIVMGSAWRKLVGSLRPPAAPK